MLPVVGVGGYVAGGGAGFPSAGAPLYHRKMVKEENDARAIGGPPPILRVMTPADVPWVAQVERVSFSEAWPATAFERELRQNPTARYIVLSAQHDEGLKVLGFAGLWLMVDEAHVVTVAVDPDYRGRGYGRLLVHGLVEVAREHGMSVATLECRVSNTAARALYREYGFYEVGIRPRYYADNREDAIIMTTEELRSAPFQQRLAVLGQELQGRFPGVVPLVSV
jgi:[ribosomal protein S18]-alanine N-acetyltransferase